MNKLEERKAWLHNVQHMLERLSVVYDELPSEPDEIRLRPDRVGLSWHSRGGLIDATFRDNRFVWASRDYGAMGAANHGEGLCSLRTEHNRLNGGY